MSIYPLGLSGENRQSKQFEENFIFYVTAPTGNSCKACLSLIPVECEKNPKFVLRLQIENEGNVTKIQLLRPFSAHSLQNFIRELQSNDLRTARNLFSAEKTNCFAQPSILRQERIVSCHSLLCLELRALNERMSKMMLCSPLEGLIQDIARIFPHFTLTAQKPKPDLKLLAEIVSELVEERFGQFEAVLDDEIVSMQALLNHSLLKSTVRTLSPSQLMTAQAVNSLAACIKELQRNIDALEPSKGDSANEVYFLKDGTGRRRWVYKPISGESEDLGIGFKKGGAAVREHLAFEISRQAKGLFPVPPTFLISLNGNVGSVQKFAKGCMEFTSLVSPLPDVSAEAQKEMREILEVETVQAMAIFDLIFMNTDRHNGNVLINKKHVVMIDNGGIMSASVKDPVKFCPLDVLEQLKQPLCKKVFEYLNTMDEESAETLFLKHHLEESAVAMAKNKIAFCKEMMARVGKDILTPYHLMWICINEHEAIANAQTLDDIQRYAAFYGEVLQNKDDSRAKKMITLGRYDTVIKSTYPGSVSDKAEFGRNLANGLMGN